MIDTTIATYDTFEPHVVDGDDYKLIADELREKVARLEATIVATARNIQPEVQSAAKPAISAQRLEAMVGRAALHGMTRSEKISALGIDPTTVTDRQLKELFGRSNSGVAARELMNTNPLRYRQLKECALILNTFGV